MRPKCVNIGAKIGPNWLLEASWGLRGDLLEPCGSPLVARGSKIAKKWVGGPPLGDPVGGPFLLIFRNLRLLWWCFFFDLFFDRFRDSIFIVLKVIFECFFDASFVVFWMTRGSEKCGFDTLFTVYKAHGSLGINGKIYEKNDKKWICLWDRFETPIWSPFWELLGCLGGAFGRQIEEKKASENGSKKMLQKRAA